MEAIAYLEIGECTMTIENEVPVVEEANVPSRPRLSAAEMRKHMVENNLTPDYLSYCSIFKDWESGQVIKTSCCGLGARFYADAIEKDKENPGYGINGMVSHLANQEYGMTYTHGYDVGFNPNRDLSDFDSEDNDSEKHARFVEGFEDGRAGWEAVKDFKPQARITVSKLKEAYANKNLTAKNRSFEGCGLTAMYSDEIVSGESVEARAVAIHGHPYVAGFMNGFDEREPLYYGEQTDEALIQYRLGHADGLAGWQAVKPTRVVDTACEDYNTPPVGMSKPITDVEDMDNDQPVSVQDADSETDQDDPFDTEDDTEDEDDGDPTFDEDRDNDPDDDGNDDE